MSIVPYSVNIDRSTLDKFVESTLVAVRFPTSAGPYDWKPIKVAQKNFKKAATCLQSHAAPAP